MQSKTTAGPDHRLGSLHGVSAGTGWRESSACAPEDSESSLVDRYRSFDETPLRALVRLAFAAGQDEHGERLSPILMRTRRYRGRLMSLLIAERWYCSTTTRVEYRGTEDGYRGIIDLAAFPPADPGAQALRHPVLIEIDKSERGPGKKTLAKLQAYPGPTTAKVVILTRRSTCPPSPGIDTLICLA